MDEVGRGDCREEFFRFWVCEKEGEMKGKSEREMDNDVTFTSTVYVYIHMHLKVTQGVRDYDIMRYFNPQTSIDLCN